eukprot:6184881-Pleurochrysis_carterae.AAC.3
MQQKVDMLLLQHRATLERDRLVCSTLPPCLPANHSSSEIARLPGPKFLLSLPSGNRAYVSMPAASVASVAPHSRPSYSRAYSRAIAFYLLCVLIIAQEQDRKRGVLEKRSIVYTSSLSQERYTLAPSNPLALPSAAPPLSTIPQLAAPLSIPSQNMLVPVRVLPPLPPVEYQSLAVREQSAVGPASVESLILAPSNPQLANNVRKRMRLNQAERLAQPSHSDVQAAKRQRAAEALITVLPHELLLAFFGGEYALLQVADLGMRKEALMKNLLRAGGSDGKTLDSARQALEQSAIFASELGLAISGLPASALLVTSLMNWVDKSAGACARGSQGGATVAAGVRLGLLLSAHLRAQSIEVSEMVDAVVAPP